MNDIKHLCVLALSIILLTGCSHEPKKNKKPRYFVTISGHINPDISKPMYLGFWARYAGYNPKCQVWINHFEGVKGMPAKTVFYPAVPDQSGHYIIKMPIDGYLPGQCDWKMAEVDMTVAFHALDASIAKSPWNTPIIVFGVINKDLPGLPVNKDRKAILQSAECISKGLGGCGNLLTAGYSTVSVLRNKNYHFFQDIN